jgi:hypothetical protein
MNNGWYLNTTIYGSKMFNLAKVYATQVDMYVNNFFELFLNVGTPKESINLTTFYGLYFSHQLHMFTNHNSFFHVVDYLWAACFLNFAKQSLTTNFTSWSLLHNKNFCVSFYLKFSFFSFQFISQHIYWAVSTI